MEYRKGFTIKPNKVLRNGKVIFTDGTNEVQPNQLSCEAYGYKYNKSTGICQAYSYSSKIEKAIKDESNIIKGSGNNAEKGTNNTLLNGQNNSTKGDSSNGFITGEVNEISNGLNNTTIIGGKMGKAVRQGEVVLGGGSYNIGSGYTQSSKIQMSCKTTDATSTSMNVQGIIGEYIVMQHNSILGYEIYLTRLETGGTSGTAGNFSYSTQRGVAKLDNGGVISIITHSTNTLGKVGVTGTFSVADSTSGDVPSITIKVADRVDVNNLWSATVYLHELRTNIDF